jgi:protocatechuate 3,4-dioxygenase beta subunit
MPLTSKSYLTTGHQLSRFIHQVNTLEFENESVVLTFEEKTMQARIYQRLILITLILCNISCSGQSPKKTSSVRLVGGPCEGCEGLSEYGNKTLSSIDTLPLFKEHEPKLKVTGTVFKKDGITPAAGVILYIYHTNRQGVYQTKGNETGWAKRHGFIRGWVKTDLNGQYTFYTFRPGAYPDKSEPEHIHLTVKEPDTNEYYLDDYLFDDDPLLTPSVRKKQPVRGGAGIMRPVTENGLLVIKRDIILGLNIPDYE